MNQPQIETAPDGLPVLRGRHDYASFQPGQLVRAPATTTEVFRVVLFSGGPYDGFLNGYPQDMHIFEIAECDVRVDGTPPGRYLLDLQTGIAGWEARP